MGNSDGNGRSLELITIGAFGYDADSFFGALQEARVDTFCDIRQRRGVRGAKYAFVNSKRLQQRLNEIGIRYLHIKELAPTKEVREAQKQADKASGVAKRERTELSPAFIEAYKSECLMDIEPDEVLARLPPDAERVALFCVEEQPEACHRSVAANWLGMSKNLTVKHLVP